MFNQKIVLVFIFFGVLTGIISFIFMGNLLRPHQQVQQEPEKAVVEIRQVEKKLNEEQEKWLELERKRNIVVLIDNDVKARPQAGLNEADLVYELPLEGGTTRFMAVYSRFDSELIGPIRSARAYTIELAKEHDPIFVHAGGSPLAFEMFNQIGNLNGLAGGVDRAFWRSNQREEPHNLYSDTQTLRRVANQEGFREEGKLPEFKYLNSDEEFSGKPSEMITINYGKRDFKVEYLYDKQSEKYLRFTAGLKHSTTTTDQIVIKNIIMQMVNTKVIDNEGRLKLDIEGRGKTVFFIQGKVIQGYWEKVNDRGTRFYTAEGEEISLIPGNTWINLVPVNVQVSY